MCVRPSRRAVPVILVKAGMADKGARDSFECPAYKTLTRNPVDGKPTGGYIFTAGLKTKQPANKWCVNRMHHSKPAPHSHAA